MEYAMLFSFVLARSSCMAIS